MMDEDYTIEIIGAVLGTATFLAIVVPFIIYCYKKRKEKLLSKKEEKTEILAPAADN